MRWLSSILIVLVATGRLAYADAHAEMAAAMAAQIDAHPARATLPHGHVQLGQSVSPSKSATAAAANAHGKAESDAHANPNGLAGQAQAAANSAAGQAQAAAAKTRVHPPHPTH